MPGQVQDPQEDVRVVMVDIGHSDGVSLILIWVEWGGLP